MTALRCYCARVDAESARRMCVGAPSRARLKNAYAFSRLRSRCTTAMQEALQGTVDVFWSHGRMRAGSLETPNDRHLSSPRNTSAGGQYASHLVRCEAS